MPKPSFEEYPEWLRRANCTEGGLRAKQSRTSTALYVQDVCPKRVRPIVDGPCAIRCGAAVVDIESFVENVYKVRLTRRLDPLDRVKALGDASVPFWFEVHMMIFSGEAPKLEHALHKALDKYRVNRVNFRKEFFRVDLETIRATVEEHHGIVEFVADAEALQYRESLKIKDEDFEFLAKVAEASGIEDEDDDLDGIDEA